MNSKFLKDLPEMVEQGVITQEVEDRIRHWYQEKEAAKPNRLLLVSGVLGALLVGLGIILILAHNWDNFSSLLKTALAFTPLFISQILVVYALRRKSEVWLEATGVLLFFSVGTAISLISQIYNIPGNIDNFLLLWIVLCAPLLYLLKSKSITILHLVFSTWWAVSSGYGYRAEIPWLFLVFLLWVLPFYRYLLYKNANGNMCAILSWGLPISATIALGTFIADSELWGFLLYVLLFGIMYQWGSGKMLKEKSLMKNGFRVIGVLGMVVIMIITSFKDVWREIASSGIEAEVELYMVVPMFILFIFLLVRNLKEDMKLDFFLLIPFILTVIFLMGARSAILATIAINIITFLTGIVFTREGALTTSFRKLNFGLLVITALIACRFFDTDLSFVFRGILFVSIGLGFFLTNYFIVRKRAGSNTKLN